MVQRVSGLRAPLGAGGARSASAACLPLREQEPNDTRKLAQFDAYYSDPSRLTMSTQNG